MHTRGGGGAGEEIAGAGALCFFFHRSVSPVLCTSPSSNLGGKGWRMQSGHKGREGGWGRLRGPVYEGTRGWLTDRDSNLPLLLFPFECNPLLFPPPPPLPLVRVRGAVVEISKVGWCFSLAALTISLYPLPPADPPDGTHTAEPRLQSSAGLFCVQTRVLTCLTCIQFSKAHPVMCLKK